MGAVAAKCRRITHRRRITTVTGVAIADRAIPGDPGSTQSGGTRGAADITAAMAVVGASHLTVVGTRHSGVCMG